MPEIEDAGLRAGYRVAVMAASEQAPGIDQLRINEKIREIEDEAYAAGFVTDVKSVTFQPGMQAGPSCRTVILYHLSPDPSYRPPM